MFDRLPAHLFPAAIILLFGSACDAPDDVPVPVAGQEDGPPSAWRAEAGMPPDRPWSQAGLEHQPRLAELRGATTDTLGWQPGTTPWRPSDVAIPPAFTREAAEQGAGFESPGELVSRLIDALGLAQSVGEDTWEITFRVMPVSEDGATGLILLWGFLDDSVAGGDYRVHLRRLDDRWFVEGMEQRAHCRRGVTEDGLCL